MQPDPDEQDTSSTAAPEPGPEQSEGSVATPSADGEAAVADLATADGDAAVAALSAGDSETPVATLPTGDVARNHLKGLIESIVFVSEHPLSVGDIAKAAKADKRLVKALAAELTHEYAARGIHFEEVAGGFVFRTNAAFAPFVRDVASKKPVRMTRAQLETLAIVAYRQPMTRPEVDDIRGVDSGPVMKMLLDRELVRILGKKDEPGRPLLYGTTTTFLEFFGLKSLKDLPSLREFTELSEDSRRVYDREMDDGSVPPHPEVGALAAASEVAAEIVDNAAKEPPATEPDATEPDATESDESDDTALTDDRETADSDYSPSAGSS
jgi:segregation and condensation protein B